ncbi:MAG: hypothetical protein A3H42_00590 [Deltaproteobacteria bacterium RIFCSPLOWO2_02_FULL_46_8]|nr:MAG: hypothetical protein A3H42_00590 [Deltaproteobacteria bacterium RIFCSPLOWO2_02_FULL_46_8]
MQLIPLIYLKNGKAVQPIGTNPNWFQENPLELARYFKSQGAEAVYLDDLNIPLTGKGENFSAVQSIQENLKLKLWISGNFRSLSTIESYAELGIDKIVLGGSVYQDPNLLKEAAQKFPQKIAVQIEVKNKKVVIPGLVAPSHKTAADYASRFEEEGVAALCYLEPTNEGLKDLCVQVKIPVLSLQDVPKMEDLEKLFECERSGLIGVVLGKTLYENRIDLKSSKGFLDELEARTAQEKTEGE